MITTELITVGAMKLQKVKSDTYMIRQMETGKTYIEAVDILPCDYTYEETDILLDVEDIES